MFTTNAYLRILLVFLLFLALFSISRLMLLVNYEDDFAGLTTFQLLTAFIHGIRFDAAITAIYIGFPLLFLALPFNWAKHIFWQALWAWIIFAIFVIFIFSLIVDNIYYEFVHRHAGPEILLVMGDIPLMVDMAISEYSLALLVFVIFIFYLAKVWHFSFQFPLDETLRTGKHSFIIFLLLLSFVFIGRGGLQHKPVRISDAFINGETSHAYLTINGTFALTQALRSSKPTQTKFMPNDKAIALTQAFVKAENENFTHSDYPLLRYVSHEPREEKPNIVVILVESFDAAHFDKLRVLKNLRPYGATPNLDKLSEQGILFTNFYATGQRSVDGLAAVLASIPTLPGFPYIGQGLEQNKLGFLGNFAKEQGYSTIFLQSSSRGSFHIDSIASQAGFDDYYGAEDIPSSHKGITRSSNWGAWDHDTLQFAEQKFSESQEPFLGFVFTSTTHTPWRVPSYQWKISNSENDLDRYINSLYYLDWSVGEFIKKAKKEDYYENTIFIITADHVSHFGMDPSDPATQFNIPLIIFGKDIESRIDASVGNQLDILPTILDLGRWSTSHSSLGRSLFSNRNDHFSFSISGSMLSHINGSDKFTLNTQKKESFISEKNQNKIMPAALQQTVFDILTSNRVYTTN